MEVAVKSKGNPNFKKKEVLDVDKTYEFELIQTYEKYKPTDDSGNKVANLYPPLYCFVNKGLAYDEKTKKQRPWRFLNHEQSIWIDEQREITKEEENVFMSDPDNQIEFRNGQLMVNGLQTSKLAALMVMDEFEGKERQLKNKPREYRLLNPDKDTEKTLSDLTTSRDAENAAWDASTEEMYEVALTLGIDLNQSDDTIRKEFVLQAKANPKNFLKQFVNPKNKFKLAFTQALTNGVISSTHETGRLTWGDSHAFITEVNSAGDVPNELASRALLDDVVVTKLFHQLAKL